MLGCFNDGVQVKSKFQSSNLCFYSYFPHTCCTEIHLKVWINKTFAYAFRNSFWIKKNP